MTDLKRVLQGLDCVSGFGHCLQSEAFAGGICAYCIKEIAKKAKELLKEQEAVEPKTGHWIFESQYCEAWSHTCSECGKRMTTAVNTFANYCWNCGAKMEGR